jgi:hypothetical protein
MKIVLYNCIPYFDVDQVYLVRYPLILKVKGDMMHFVKIENVTLFPTKQNKKCIISPATLRISRYSTEQTCSA